MRSLPKSVTFPDGSTCGNFDLLDAATQKTAGYYPYTANMPEYDSRIQKIVTLPEIISEDSVTGNHEVVDIPLEEIKESRNVEIRQLRDEKLNDSVFTYDSQEFKFSEQVANDVTQFFNMASIVGEAAFPYNWTQANNEQYTFTNIEQYTAFGITLGVHKNTIIGTAKYHMANIAALDDALDIVNYDITAGW
jgi:hypothetical protein